MSQAKPSTMLRSVGAIVAGVLVGVILSLGTDLAMQAIGVFPPFGQPVGSQPLLLATIYRTLYGVAAGYITARLAPARPMKHAMILGILGFIVSIAGAALTWNKGPAFGPHWYPVALVILALPTAWLGGKLRTVQLPAEGWSRETTPKSNAV